MLHPKFLTWLPASGSFPLYHTKCFWRRHRNNIRWIHHCMSDPLHLSYHAIFYHSGKMEEIILELWLPHSGRWTTTQCWVPEHDTEQCLTYGTSQEIDNTHLETFRVTLVAVDSKTCARFWSLLPSNSLFIKESVCDKLEITKTGPSPQIVWAALVMR